MKLNQLGLLGLCGLLLCGCTNLKAASDSENNPTDDTNVIDSAGRGVLGEQASHTLVSRIQTPPHESDYHKCTN